MAAVLTSYELNRSAEYASAEPSRPLARLYFRRFLTDQSSTLRLAASHLSRVLATTVFEICFDRDEVVP
jgi:hypothetical protein